MADYTPPLGDDVDFTFSGDYTAPDGDQVNFLFGIIATVLVTDVSRTSVYGSSVVPGVDFTVITWTTTEDGPYVIEMGGTGYGTGDTIASGTAVSYYDMKNTITDDEIEAAASYAGSDSYRFDIYVQSEDGIWNPQD